ncbi:MAG: hypothetical protein ACYTEQ_15590 [Planctomycetota bacterium]|jgi:hypothetical protein
MLTNVQEEVFGGGLRYAVCNNIEPEICTQAGGRITGKEVVHQLDDRLETNAEGP